MPLRMVATGEKDPVQSSITGAICDKVRTCFDPLLRGMLLSAGNV